MEPARDHDVEAERSAIRGEEELATDLAGQCSLETARSEHVDGQRRYPVDANIGVPTDSGPYSNSVTKTSPRAHQLGYADAEVTALLRHRERRDVHDRARPLGGVDGRAAHDAAFPSLRNLEADAVRGEVCHRVRGAVGRRRRGGGRRDGSPGR